jgi:hypothetical protein
MGGYLEEGSYQWPAAVPLLIQDGTTTAILDLVSIDYLKLLGQLITFFCGLLWVISGRLLSVISYATQTRCPPSWIWFPSIIWQTPVSTGPIFLWLIGGAWRKVPFIDQCLRSFKMAGMATILDLVSVDYLTNASVNWSHFLWAFGGDWRKVPVAEWLGCQTLNQRVVGSNPGEGTAWHLWAVYPKIHSSR